MMHRDSNEKQMLIQSVGELQGLSDIQKRLLFITFNQIINVNTII